MKLTHTETQHPLTHRVVCTLACAHTRTRTYTVRNFRWMCNLTHTCSQVSVLAKAWKLESINTLTKINSTITHSYSYLVIQSKMKQTHTQTQTPSHSQSHLHAHAHIPPPPPPPGVYSVVRVEKGSIHQLVINSLVEGRNLCFR